jgi:arylsulfatase A-like enzyme
LPLLMMRANDSGTAISVGVIFSGLGPTESRDAIHTAPLIFDFARAAGIDAGYWTSQHPLFANARLFMQDLPVSRRALATDLDPGADLDNGAKDELVTRRAAREVAELSEPFLAVVHYANTHFPYRVDKNDAPFQPATMSKAPGDNAIFLNQYRNAVHAQDKTIADLVQAVRALPAGARTVIVLTSDHGEAFREHGQLGHTASIYDEEVHVPAWIDAPGGALDEPERRGLEAAQSEPTYHADLAPTILDLLGLWDAPEIARFRGRMAGVSLLRERDPRARAVPMALTNCNELWGCAFRNWGLMRGFFKLEAREWDSDWHCWDVRADPAELRDLGPAACGDLPFLAARTYGSTPRDSPPMPETDE